MTDCKLCKFIERDEFWGGVLIALGVAALVWHPFDKLDALLADTSNVALSAMVLTLAGIAIAIALFGSPTAKALTVFWIVTP